MSQRYAVGDRVYGANMFSLCPQVVVHTRTRKTRRGGWSTSEGRCMYSRFAFSADINTVRKIFLAMTYIRRLHNDRVWWGIHPAKARS